MKCFKLLQGSIQYFWIECELSSAEKYMCSLRYPEAGGRGSNKMVVSSCVMFCCVCFVVLLCCYRAPPCPGSAAQSGRTAAPGISPGSRRWWSAAAFVCDPWIWCPSASRIQWKEKELDWLSFHSLVLNCCSVPDKILSYSPNLNSADGSRRTALACCCSCSSQMPGWSLHQKQSH